MRNFRKKPFHRHLMSRIARTKYDDFTVEELPRCTFSVCGFIENVHADEIWLLRTQSSWLLVIALGCL